MLAFEEHIVAVLTSVMTVTLYLTSLFHVKCGEDFELFFHIEHSDVAKRQTLRPWGHGDHPP